MMQVRRRLMLSQGQSTDLYPIGTDVITKYIGRDENGLAYFVSGKMLNNSGEYVDGDNNAASPVYIPVDENYRFAKNAKRILIICFYDSNYGFISRLGLYNNLTAMDLQAFPVNTAYFRVGSHSTATSNWQLAITRTS